MDSVKKRKRASETVTFRLTGDEKKMLTHLAEVDETTQTELLRMWIWAHAKQRQVESVPATPVKKRPGRPRKKRASTAFTVGTALDSKGTNVGAAGRSSVHAQTIAPAWAQAPADTFGGLVKMVVAQFAGRTANVQQELAETLHFVTHTPGTEPLIPIDLPLAAISTAYLASVREIIKEQDLRFPVKNRYLNYLRMVFNVAVKEKLVGKVQPAVDLAPFTAREVADALPMPIKSPFSPGF